jgi:hypothetical protein
MTRKKSDLLKPACSNCDNEYLNTRETGITHTHGESKCLEKQDMPHSGICDPEKYKVKLTYESLVDTSSIDQQH